MKNYSHPNISTPIKTIIIINIVMYVFIILPGTGRFLLNLGALIPSKTFTGGQIWRLLSYMFLHDPHSSFHLLFNMLALWMFSRELEDMWGSKRLLQFYFISGIGSGCFSLIHLFIPSMSSVGVIGASGAVLALLTAYAYYFPHREILLFFIIPVNIRIVVIGYALISLFGTLSPHGVVSHITHLGGIIVALLYIKWYPVIISQRDKMSQLQRDKMSRDNKKKVCTDEQSIHQNVDAKIGKKQFFEEQIDPILDKISREGMESLTPQEKKLLESVAKSKDGDYLKKNSVLPFIRMKKGHNRK